MLTWWRAASSCVLWTLNCACVCVHFNEHCGFSVLRAPIICMTLASLSKDSEANQSRKLTRFYSNSLRKKQSRKADNECLPVPAVWPPASQPPLLSLEPGTAPPAAHDKHALCPVDCNMKRMLLVMCVRTWTDSTSTCKV